MFPSFSSRPWVLSAPLLFAITAFADAADSVVVFNEVQYQPPATGTEWIELRNLNGVNVDMSGWRLSGGASFTFPEGTVIPGHGFLLVAAEPGNATLSGKGALGPLSGALSNSGETLRLRNNSDRIMDELSYSDGGDWPAGADGSGSTLAKLDQNSADSRAGNWIASPEAGGTPGAANFPLAGAPATVTNLVALTSTWKARPDNSAPPADWKTAAFDDSTWTSGAASFYAGNPQTTGAGEGLLAWWPLNETSGTTAANAAPGGSAATLTGATWINDATRGPVLDLSGTADYVSAGNVIPVMTLTNDFTWAFFAYSTQAANTNVVLGNRYSPSGADFSPREFIKFTTAAFEYHRNTTGENIDYPDFPTNTWVHHAVVKTGALMTYYRNGTASGSVTITAGTSNPQPLYFGGDKTAENWAGRMDDVALWTRALPQASIAGLANGTLTPLTAPTTPNSSALVTGLPAGSTTYYFRKTFPFSGNVARTSLALQHLLDDGAVFYLNGTEIQRTNLPAGAVTHGTLATDEITDASLSELLTIPGTALVNGTNVLAVEVHQHTASDPDMLFAASLTSTEEPAPPVDLNPAIVLNEITAASDPAFRVELTNTGASPVDLTGWTLRSSAGDSALLPPQPLNPGAFLVLDATALGFTPASGDRLFLTAADGTLTDARAVTNRLRGRIGGRWLYPSAATPGTANAFAFQDAIVINEIMYNPPPLQATETLPFRKSNDQWVELYNRSAAPVDLGGWQFSDGVSFTFPPGTTLAPDSYLIVAGDAALFTANHPSIPVAGQWSGSLSGSGEHLLLTDASGNPADELRYADGGRWPDRADAQGSSMELRDARADNSQPDSWAASDESARTAWQTVSYTATATNGQGDPTQYNEFVLGLLDSGEVLLDDISVIEDPATVARQLIQNGDFSSGATTFWRMLGTHRHTEVIDDPDSPGNKVLHLTAGGPTEHMHNHAETTLKAGASFVTINNSKTYQISFRVRWLSGSNLLNTRLYFNRCARTTVLNTPATAGTPGAVNSTRVANAGPASSGLTHSPAVPAVGQAATVSVALTDPDGIAGATLYRSVNGGAFTSSPMVAGENGLYTGSVPAQASAAKVQFYIDAVDTAGAHMLIPQGGPESRAMIPWADGQANLNYGDCQPNNFRIVMTPADVTFLHTVTNVMSNDRLPCTVIYNESEITYDCGIRLKGSERGRSQSVRVGYNVSFPGDQPFLGAHGTVAIDRSGAGNQFSQKEILVKHAINHAGGIPGMEDDLIRVIAPQNAHTGSAMLLKSRFDNEWLDNQLDGGSDGRMFEYELIYYPTSTTGGVEGLKLPEPDNVSGVNVRTLGGLDKELYRWHWLIDTNKDADDYSGLISMLQAFGLSGTAYRDAMAARVDVDQWLRSFAVQTLFGIGDSYSSGSQHNLLVYLRPSDGRAMYFPWDMDFTFSNGATSGVTANSDLTRMLAASPEWKRAYYGHLHDIISTTFNSTYMTPWATHYSCFLPTESLTGWISYINTRRTTVLNLINSAVAPTSYAITTPDGTSTAGSSIALQGTGWVDITEIRLASTGAPLALTWLTDRAWQATVPVSPGSNAITLNSYNRQGGLTGAATVNITGTGSVTPASAENLAVSEIMYHPADPSAAELTAGFTDADDFEFIEVVNTSAGSVDLAGAGFTDGIALTFPATILTAGQRAVFVRNPAAFTARYGAGVAIAGEYGSSLSPALSNSGEHLQLTAADGGTIASFAYNDKLPWPAGADGNGYSLVLMCPGLRDPALPESWRHSVAAGGSPGADDSVSLTAWLAANSLTDPLSDDDQDGQPALLEYATGQDPALTAAPTGPLATILSGESGDFLTLTLTVPSAADHVLTAAEFSPSLTAWDAAQPAAITWLGRTANGDGTETLRFQATAPATTRRQFLRLRFTACPAVP